MKQYTDVPITITVNGVDLTTISQPHLTFSQGYNTVVDITDITIISATACSVVLTQAQTGLFKLGDIQCQLNFFDGTGKRKASEIATIAAESNLLRRILSNGS